MGMRTLLLAFTPVLAMSAAMAAVRSAGPGKPYATPCQAIAAAQDGDTIEIDAAGNYDGDVCVITKNNLVIRGVNGRAKIDAAGRYAAGKGIWVVAGDNTVIENIEFSGAKVPDRNGAGIRLDSGNLTVRNCAFRNNENGILGGFYGNVLIEHSEFENNGYGDGYSHNIYLNAGVAEFTLRYSASRRANAGHLVKSRAAKNFILYNRLTQEDGAGSYEIDLPNAGLAYVIGNIIQQGETTQNRGMLSYGFEGQHASVPNQLYAVNNTFVSTRAAGATFIQVAPAVTAQPVIRNNIFAGGGNFALPAGAQMAGNVSSGDMGFLDPAAFDYRISNVSAALNAGVDPGAGNGFPLRPAMQYLHPLCALARQDVGPIDAGAFEYGVPESDPLCAGPVQPPPPPAPELAAWTVSPSAVAPGGSLAATVLLSAPAGSGGAAVFLASSRPEVIAVPASVTVPEGAASASLNLQAAAVSSETSVTLTASQGGRSLLATVTVRPEEVKPALVMLAKVGRSPSQVRPGGSFSLSIQLEQPAPAGGALVLLSAGSFVKLPSSLVIPAGSSSATVAGLVETAAPAGIVTLWASSANRLSTTLRVRRER